MRETLKVQVGRRRVWSNKAYGVCLCRYIYQAYFLHVGNEHPEGALQQYHAQHTGLGRDLVSFKVGLQGLVAQPAMQAELVAGCSVFPERDERAIRHALRQRTSRHRQLLGSTHRRQLNNLPHRALQLAGR